MVEVTLDDGSTLMTTFSVAPRGWRWGPSQWAFQHGTAPVSPGSTGGLEPVFGQHNLLGWNCTRSACGTERRVQPDLRVSGVDSLASGLEAWVTAMSPHLQSVMARSAIPGLLLALTSCASPPAHTRMPLSPLPGTYTLEICERRCAPESERPLATGTLVLDSGALAVDVEQFIALSGGSDRAAREGLERQYREGRENGAPNACFALHAPAHPMLSRAGPSRLAAWRPETGGGVLVVLVQGADDAYIVRAAPGSAPDRLEGRGTWTTAGLERGEDVVVLRRTGPPSSAACLSSGRIP